jgi:hypothetical protein
MRDSGSAPKGTWGPARCLMTTRWPGTWREARVRCRSPEGWRNRIVGHAQVAPAELLPNPRNWRTHPPEQQRALRGALTAVGWVTEVIFNRSTGNVIDGHLRIEHVPWWPDRGFLGRFGCPLHTLGFEVHVAVG